MAVHSVVPGQALPPGIDQRFRLSARTDAAEQLIFRGVRADEGRIIRRGHAVAVREEHDSRDRGVVAVEQVLHGEHGFLRERRLRVPPGEHRAAAVRKAVHGGVGERAVGQLHAADVGALRMADHGEHALRLQIGLKPGIADAVRAVFADQPALRVHDRNAGQPQPLGVLPQRVLAAVERQAVQLLHLGRAAHERLGHGGFVVLHVGGGLLLDEADQLVHAVLAALHI